MKMHLKFVALTLLVATSFAPRAVATCLISPDGKSINVVTDNGSSDEKSCSVKCQVDTNIGVVQVACGGTTPPLAKAHSLCDFDKPEPYYKKVISFEDSCKGESASTTPASPPAAAAVPSVKPGTHICRISPDGLSFDAMIANPYAVEASCQVNCQVSTTIAGTQEQSSCTKNVAPGVGPVVLCSRTIDKGKFVKVLGGSGSCFDPTPKPATAEPDDAELQKAMQDPAKMQEYMQKQLGKTPPPPTSTQKESDEEMQKLMDDPAKMQEYIRKQMDPQTQKMFDKTN